MLSYVQIAHMVVAIIHRSPGTISENPNLSGRRCSKSHQTIEDPIRITTIFGQHISVRVHLNLKLTQISQTYNYSLKCLISFHFKRINV